MAITIGSFLIIFMSLGVEINLPIIAVIILVGSSSYLLTHYINDRIKFLQFLSEFKSAINIK